MFVLLLLFLPNIDVIMSSVAASGVGDWPSRPSGGGNSNKGCKSENLGGVNQAEDCLPKRAPEEQK